MVTVFLGLGSNLGNRGGNISRALSELEKKNINVLKMSTIIETEPVGGPPQGKYLNAVAKASTSLAPQELLKILKAIETDLGRIKTTPNGPRHIDIDILLYGEESIQTPQLTIPHPFMRTRDFVMIPLREIAPETAEKLT